MELNKVSILSVDTLANASVDTKLKQTVSLWNAKHDT